MVHFHKFNGKNAESLVSAFKQPSYTVCIRVEFLDLFMIILPGLGTGSAITQYSPVFGVCFPSFCCRT